MLGAYLFRLLYCFSTTLLFFDKKTHLIPLVTMMAGILNVTLVSIFALTLNFESAVYAFVLSMSFFVIFVFYNNIYYEMNYFKELVVIISLIIFSSYINKNYSFTTQNYIYSALVLILFYYLVKSGKISSKHVKKTLKRS